MLSRTADHLFWMARYMERAENTARMLDVNYQTSLLPQSADTALAGWSGLLSISELTWAYSQQHRQIGIVMRRGIPQIARIQNSRAVQQSFPVFLSLTQAIQKFSQYPHLRLLNQRQLLQLRRILTMMRRIMMPQIHPRNLRTILSPQPERNTAS